MNIREWMKQEELEGEETIEDWRYHDYLTPNEAACLAFGRDPNDFLYHDSNIDFEDRSTLEQFGNISNLTSALQSTVESEGLRISPDKQRIHVDDLILWLEKHNIEAPFFRSKESQAPKPKKRPEYQTHMMIIMYDVIERYYGKNYDPNDSDSIDSSKVVIKWIREHCKSSNGEELSAREASAIDILTRPDHIRKPKVKNK